jgi:hypothetical protein
MNDRDYRSQTTMDRKVDRRSILLGTTSLAAGSVRGSGAAITVAEAQPAPASAPRGGGQA